MNWLVFIAGLVGLFAVFGHFTMGSKRFLKPMLDATFDEVPKKVMHSVFHYISVFMVLSTGALILVGVGVDFNTDTTLLVQFIALNYSLFAIAQIAIALTSGVPAALTKMFQWVFWIIIAVLAWFGA